MLEEVSDGAKLHVFERFVQRALRLSELAVARTQLFQTLDVGGELIGGFDEAVLIRMLLCLQIGIELFFELGRQGICDLFDGELFELFIFTVGFSYSPWMLLLKYLTGVGRSPVITSLTS